MSRLRDGAAQPALTGAEVPITSALSSSRAVPALNPGDFCWVLGEAFSGCLIHAHLCSLADISTVLLGVP